MNLATCPSRSLVRMRESASLQEAAQLMCDMSMGALGVDRDQEFIGLVTERDLLWATARGKDSTETKIGDIVNDLPIVVDGPVSADTAARRMVAGHVRHLLIRIDGDLHIVSLRDLIEEEVRDPHSEGSHSVSAGEMRRMFGN